MTELAMVAAVRKRRHRAAVRVGELAITDSNDFAARVDLDALLDEVERCDRVLHAIEYGIEPAPGDRIEIRG